MNATRSATLAVLCAALSLPLAAQKGHVDARYGFEVKPPKGWTELPAGTDRGQCVMLFAGPRALAAKAGSVHTPTLRVLFFQKGLTDAHDDADGLPRRTPFRDLDDYVRRGHGEKAKFTSREAAKAGDFEGRRFVVDVPNDAGDRTLTGATIALDDGELAFVFEVVTDQIDKERKEYERCLDALGKFERDANAPGRAVAPWLADPSAWQGKDANARAAGRKQFADAVVAAPPETGWKATKNKYWTVQSLADAGFTKKAVAAAEVAHTWCEKNLPKLTAAPPLPAVLRIFDSPDHYRAFKERDPDQREYSSDRRELYFVDDPDAGTADGYGPLFRAVLWHWIDDADPDILLAMPRWLDNGLWEYMRSTRLKGKVIEFLPSEVETGRIAYYRQKNQPMPAIWNLIQESQQPSPTDGANEDVWGYTPECARIVRWLCEYDGGKAFDKPTLLKDYLAGLGEAWRTVGPEPTKDVDTARLTDAQVKAMNQRFYTWRDSVLKACNDRVLPLSVEAWTATNEKWLKFNQDFK